MIISGQYTTAEIFTENIEEQPLQWAREILGTSLDIKSNKCDQPVLNTKSRKPTAEFS